MIKGRVFICLPLLLMTGGTFILYMLLGQSLHFERYSHGGDISQTDPVYSTLSGTLESGSEVDTQLPERSWIGGFKVFRVGLLIWTLLGASCVIADGLLTPAVSVVSAVSGEDTRLLDSNFRSRCS